MSNEERRRILHVLAEGKISPAEAEDLLAALDGPPSPDPVAAPARPAPPFPSDGPTQRTVVIQVESDDTKLNLRLPLGLAHAASRFIPRQAQHYLDEYHIDLGEVLTSLGHTPAEGTLLELEDDDDKVRIAVE